MVTFTVTESFIWYFQEQDYMRGMMRDPVEKRRPFKVRENMKNPKQTKLTLRLRFSTRAGGDGVAVYRCRLCYYLINSCQLHSSLLQPTDLQ